MKLIQADGCPNASIFVPQRQDSAEVRSLPKLCHTELVGLKKKSFCFFRSSSSCECSSKAVVKSTDYPGSYPGSGINSLCDLEEVT